MGQETLNTAAPALLINEEGKMYLSTFSSWSKFVAIFGIVVSSIYSLFLLIGLVSLCSMSSYQMSDYGYHGLPYDKNTMMLIVVIALATLAFSVYIYARLLSACNCFKMALATNNTDQMTKGLKGLRFLSVVAGICCIIVAVCFVISLSSTIAHY